MQGLTVEIVLPS